METCCAAEECVNKSTKDVTTNRHWELSARACEGWKFKWTDPGPQVEVIHAVVPGPFDSPKILKALPYKLVSKCGCCALRSRPRLRNGIPDPWLEYLEYDAWREGRDDDSEDSEESKDARHVKKCLKITDFVWQQKGLALLQGIPDPWKADVPCECKIKTESKHKKKKSHGKESPRRRSSTNERQSPRRRSSINEEEASSQKTSTSEEKIPRRNSTNKEKPPRSRRSTFNEEEFPRRRSSNQREENTKRRSKNYDEEPTRRRSKSEDKAAKYAMCYAGEPSKTAYVCCGGVVPACLSDYFVEEYRRRRSTSVKRPSKKYDEEIIRRLSKKYDKEAPTKRRSNNYVEEPTKRRSRIDDTEVIPDRRHSKSKNKKKKSTKKLSDATSDDSNAFSAEAQKKSRKRSDTSEHKVEKRKNSHSVKPESSDYKNRIETAGKTPKKLTTCGNGFDKVRQRLQELENELKAKEAAKELKLREMEQLSKLKKKSRKEKKRTGKVREKFDKQKGNGWLDDPDETIDKVRSAWRESISPTGNYCLDMSKTKELTAKNSTCRNNKNASRWLDEPGEKKLPKESSKSPKKTEELKAPKTSVKSIRKDARPVTAMAYSPPSTTSMYTRPMTPRTPSPTNPRRVSYTDDQQATSRMCTPYSASRRRVSYCDEPQPSASRRCSPRCRDHHEVSHVDEPVTPTCSLSKSPRGTASSTASQRESKKSAKRFLEEINSRIEITRDALNSPDMKSVAVQPFREETTKSWRCPGRDACPRMRERAGGDEGSELFVRRVRVGDVAELGLVSRFDDKSVQDFEASDGYNFNARADRDCIETSGRSMTDFKRRQKEIEELYVESFSEHD